ncbi:MAG: hypothetical protein QM599_12965 [Pseudoxanthomonas sp.]
MTAPKNKSIKSSPKSGSGKSGANITHEQIEQDIADFEKAGGKVEKLGNTNTLKKIR